MKLNISTALLAATLLAGGIGTAVAEPPPPEHGPRVERNGLPPQFESLGLSDAQKAKIKALHEAQRADRKEDRAALKALHDSLRDLSPAAPNYTQEVDRIATALGQEQAQRIRERAALRQQVWAVLTPTQQAQLAAMPKPEFDGPRKMRWHKAK